MSLEIFPVKNLTYKMVCPKCKEIYGITVLPGNRDINRDLYKQLKSETCHCCGSELHLSRLKYDYVE